MAIFLYPIPVNMIQTILVILIFTTFSTRKNIFHHKDNIVQKRCKVKGIKNINNIHIGNLITASITIKHKNIIYSTI